jgi:hypothetical protein
MYIERTGQTISDISYPIAFSLLDSL